MARGGSNSGHASHTPPPPPQDAALNPLSVYYIAPGENPAISLVSPLLSTKNYHSWARAMKRSLISKNKFKFVNGSLPMPEEFDPSYDAWERCNNMVMSWIFNSVEPAIAQSIVYLEVAATTWNLLKKRFAQANRVRIFELQQEITALKQGTSTVTHYFAELTTLWQELENFRPFLACTCTIRCVCMANHLGLNYRSEDCIMKFLSGLSDEYEVVKTRILMMEPFPDIDKAFSLVVQHERRITSNESEDSHTFVNVVDTKKQLGRGRGSPFGGKGNYKVCSYCGKSGHTIDVCYRKHGFPAGFRGKNQASVNHSIGEVVDNADTGSVGESESSNQVSMTLEQFKTLMSLIQPSNNASTPVSAPTSSQIAAVTTISDTKPQFSGPHQFEDDWFS